MIISCNDCDWAICETVAPVECPECGSENISVCDATPVPEQAREGTGATGTATRTTVFPTTYPAAQEYDHRVTEMTPRQCLEELNTLGVDFDWINRRPIPTAIILPRPMWICGVRLKYNASGRPQRNWTPPTAPAGGGGSVDLEAGAQRTHRPGRPIDAKAALAVARFLKHLHDNLHVVQVDHAGIFPGRGNPASPVVGAPHVWGKGIDFCWFYLSNSGQTDVAGFYGVPMSLAQSGQMCRDWGNLEQPPTTPKQRFMRQMDVLLREHFTLVLSPDDTSQGRGTGNHTTHFHVDVHTYRSYAAGDEPIAETVETETEEEEAVPAAEAEEEEELQAAEVEEEEELQMSQSDEEEELLQG